MSSPKNKIIAAFIALMSLTVLLRAQNGMYFDDKHTFMIPMLENNIVKGHAYVYLLDKVSKDSNSFMIQVFDEYLHDVGEKKFTLDSKYTFSAAVFNGTNIVTKFLKKQEGVRYLVFDQQATILFDTSFSVKLRKPQLVSETNFQQTPIWSVTNQGVIDYLLAENNSTIIQYIGNDNHTWQYVVDGSHPTNVQMLASDNKFIVNSIYTYQPGKHYNDVRTAIQILSSQGAKITETNLYKNDSICFYPISADIQKNGIEVISEFTLRAHEFSKVKFGVCIHKFDVNGKLVSEHFNEFTQTLVKDSVVKKYKLLVHSYLYMHKATRLQNGNWLVAAEQFLKTRLTIKLSRNPSITYNKKNICLLELDDHAELVKIHVEPNKPDGVRVPRKYYRRPQNGSMVVNANSRLDINYFVRDESDSTENISFVFVDGNYLTGKLSLGNMLYKNGTIKVDKFVIPTYTSKTRIGILPARYGHVLLIKLDPQLGIFDFENIKFNN